MKPNYCLKRLSYLKYTDSKLVQVLSKKRTINKWLLRPCKNKREEETLEGCFQMITTSTIGSSSMKRELMTLPSFSICLAPNIKVNLLVSCLQHCSLLDKMSY